MYRLIVESTLGLRLETDRLYIEPCIPSEWESYKINYRFRETMYLITVFQSHGDGEKQSVTVDGVKCPGNYISLVNDRQEHRAEVKLITMHELPGF
jgi:cyclic beta-1,2-glucan synthetase